MKYAARLAGSLTPVSSVMTKITLERATSKGGKPYALFNFEVVPRSPRMGRQRPCLC